MLANQLARRVGPNRPDFKKRMAEVGAEPIGNSPSEMAKQIKENTETYARLVKQANVVIE
jgi:tripartite-type tricarboxylate transporter receptor subunit TctC